LLYLSACVADGLKHIERCPRSLENLWRRTVFVASWDMGPVVVWVEPQTAATEEVDGMVCMIRVVMGVGASTGGCSKLGREYLRVGWNGDGGTKGLLRSYTSANGGPLW